MSGTAEFDVFGCALDGINLIEASAGTGKTWNICGLYLRLLLERNLEVRQILVVTFTNAATAELRARVRSRIVETLDFVRDGDQTTTPDDPFVPQLVQAVEQRVGITRPQIVAVLAKALQYFDEASIYTIHGFCQRALADASFSAALPARLELVADDTEMLMEVVHDFWRRRVASPACAPLLAACLLERGDTPEKYAQLLRRSLAKPRATCRWPAGLDEPANAIDPSVVTGAFAAARKTWTAQRDAIVATVTAALPGLNARWYTLENVQQGAAQWDTWLASGLPLASLPEKSRLDLYASDVLANRARKNQIAPAHEFFDQAQSLLAARGAVAASLDLERLRLIRDLIDSGGPDLRRRKRERRVVAFDDILYNLFEALEAEAHPELAASLREKFPVALIDEFQDTDPLQFAIFDRIYGGGELSAFLVGDPKQAIYSFRNADLHAYLRARRSATRQYTLARNQRSTKGLVEALNGLFATTANAFMLEGLDYHPVAMGDKDRQALSDDTVTRADLQVWMLPLAPDGEALSKTAAMAGSARATAAEIARLIAEAEMGRAFLGERALRAADIAVLVRTHAQGSAVKRELALLAIGSVELSQASVFATADAEEVERVLIAISQPSRDTLLRGALATEMIGCDATRIAAIAADEVELTSYLGRFAGYRDLWLRQGVGVMFRRLLAEEKVSARMLCRPDGERRLTNLLHLGEQIHQAAATHESPDALLRWLATQRQAGTADEVAQLRLDSDRNLVQIVTIHKAKGLEFPVVFCPFLWDGGTRSSGLKPEGREYHNAVGDAVIDFRLDQEVGDENDRIKAQIRLEEAAESLRLVYVALTRAAQRCYLVAGAYTTAGRAASTTQSTRSLLNWLVAGGEDTPVQWFATKRTPSDIAAAWGALATRLAPHLDLAALPAAAGVPVRLAGPAPETLAAIPPPKAIPPAWRITSFSGLSSEARNESAANDHDARVAEAARRVGDAPAHVAPDDILRFPRGTGAGECLHAIFEGVDYADNANWKSAIAAGLFAYPQFLSGVPAAEQPTRLANMVMQMLANVMNAVLPDGIVLGTLPVSRRLTELEFSLPLPHGSAPALNAMLRASGYDVPRLAFRDLEGYLKGYVDLVFEHDSRYYLLDWKSNHLGYSASDYGPRALQAAMTEHSYHLQYLLYALALQRYLRHRLPAYRHDTHFGGVFYLFVRGVRPEWRNPDGSPAGVFHHRPSATTLARLESLFAGKPMKAAS